MGFIHQKFYNHIFLNLMRNEIFENVHQSVSANFKKKVKSPIDYIMMTFSMN